MRAEEPDEPDEPDEAVAVAGPGTLPTVDSSSGREFVMRVPLLFGVLMAAALVGCKKTAKNNPPDSAPPPAQSGGGDSGGIMPAGGVGIVLNPASATEALNITRWEAAAVRLRLEV